MSDSLLLEVESFIERSWQRVAEIRAGRRQEIEALLHRLDELAAAAELQGNPDFLTEHESYREALQHELAGLADPTTSATEMPMARQSTIAEIAEAEIAEVTPIQLIESAPNEPESSPTSPDVEVPEEAPGSVVATAPPIPEPEPPRVAPAKPLSAREINRRKQIKQRLEARRTEARTRLNAILRQNLLAPELRLTVQAMAAELNELRCQALEIDQSEIAERILSDINDLRSWKGMQDPEFGFVYGLSKEHVHCAEEWTAVKHFYQALDNAHQIRRILDQNELKQALRRDAEELLSRLRLGFCQLQSRTTISFVEPELKEICGTEDLAKKLWSTDERYFKQAQQIVGESERLLNRLTKELKQTVLLDELTANLEDADDSWTIIENSLKAGLTPSNTDLIGIVRAHIGKPLDIKPKTKDGQALLAQLKKSPKSKNTEPREAEAPLPAQEPVQRLLQSKTVLILGGHPDEQKRQSLEEALGTSVSWPDVKEETPLETLYAHADRHDVVIRFARFSRHSTRDVKTRVKQQRKHFYDITGGQGVNNIVQQIFDQSGLATAVAIGNKKGFIR